GREERIVESLRTIDVVAADHHVTEHYPSSVNDDRPDAFARVHQVEALVDVLDLQRVRDHRVDGDLPVHVPVDDPGHVRAALRAAERRAAPVAAGDELE